MKSCKRELGEKLYQNIMGMNMKWGSKSDLESTPVPCMCCWLPEDCVLKLLSEYSISECLQFAERFCYNPDEIVEEIRRHD